MGLLRFYLALCVVMAHVATFPFPIGIPAHCAVMLFFIISGFYITMILNKTYVGAGSGIAFFISRFFRLWPVFIIIAVLTMVAPLLLPHYGDNPNKLIWPAISNGTMPFWPAVSILFSNFFMVLHDWQFYFSSNLSEGFTHISGFHGGADLSVYDFVPQAWSIGVEISFYLIAPFIVRNMRAIMIFTILSLLSNLYWIHVGARFEPWHYAFLPSVLYLFMLGAIAFHIFLNGWLKTINWKDAALAIITIAVFIFVSIKLDADRPLYITWEPLRFIRFVVAIPILFIVTKNWKIDRFIGELSYPLYLCHLLVLHVCKALAPQGHVGNGILVIMISIAFSVVLLLAVDSPVNAWRHRVAKRMMRSSRESEDKMTPTHVPVLS